MGILVPCGSTGFVKHSCHFVCLEEGLLTQVEKWKEEGGEGFNGGEGLRGGWVVFLRTEASVGCLDVAFNVRGGKP